MADASGPASGPRAFEAFASHLLERRPIQTAVVRNVDSTNRLLRSAVSEIAADDVERLPPLALLAWQQQAGRGRLGRQWQSDPGLGVYLSLFWPLTEGAVNDSSQLSTLPLRVGCRACEVLREIGAEVALKWPNDLFSRSSKLGGILIELVRERKVSGAVIGIGVNVEHSESEVYPGATSLRMTGVRSSTAEVARALRDGLVAELRVERSPSEIVAEYQQHSMHRSGDRISWSSPSGRREGVFRGIDPDGGLRLETDTGVEVMHAGEIVLGETATERDR